MAPPILSLALPSETGRVLSIQSHTVQGYVGNKSAVFPLQLLGYDVDPINSVQFSNHTGKMLISLHLNRYPTFKGQVLNGQQLWELIEGLEANDLLFYTHLLTGYIGSVSFLNTVLEVVSKLRAVNPKLTYGELYTKAQLSCDFEILVKETSYLPFEKPQIVSAYGEYPVCDPVMGDEGKLYVPPELVAVYREKVVPVASMLTPNQFEAEQLTGLRIVSEKDGREACNILHAAGPPKVVITSINIDDNLLLIGSHQKEMGKSPEQFRIAIPKIPAYFTVLALHWPFHGQIYLLNFAAISRDNLLDVQSKSRISQFQFLHRASVPILHDHQRLQRALPKPLHILLVSRSRMGKLDDDVLVEAAEKGLFYRKRIGVLPETGATGGVLCAPDLANIGLPGYSPETTAAAAAAETMSSLTIVVVGTGDLMTALLLGWSNKYPDNLDKAAELAVSSLQALLQRTLNDYKMVGYNPESSSLEIRLIQSQDDIRHPQVKYMAERYS
ncbi:hypothetical protein RHSIM_Rhsim08G0085100 [Rhododendron simsii]|uniref:pyridoxal kinase n=1 Tax=Rhododendron simsii TaxID=118357 RepID=A0A834GPF0_RHOSS|nr:hypothetical protein RHSIM_Rhsim08G0085100 [Rhododendron simsii]